MNIQNDGNVPSQIIEEAKRDDHIILPSLYSGRLEIVGGIGEVWCTFSNDLLNKLSHEQKKEMFQKLQAVIDEYAKEVNS